MLLNTFVIKILAYKKHSLRSISFNYSDTINTGYYTVRFKLNFFFINLNISNQTIESLSFSIGKFRTDVNRTTFVFKETFDFGPKQ